ncbi:MAG TPA: hypothetical protein DEG44_01355, partial [Candidatus Kerfeldbacteria bacterium]|nr:hypothetical protein [Candidatus Kerfeldbacteria bacterium]
VDNASSDGTVAWLNTQEILPIQFIQNSENVWFAKGNNQGIQQATGEFIYICNDDIVLAPTAIERLVRRMNQDSSIAMVGGKMLKLIDGQPSHVLDSAGIVLHRSGRAVNRGEQVADTGQFDQAEPIFGITGAGMLLRRSALERVKHGSAEYFDNDFVAYKEDSDLSWRLHRAGFSVWYEPAAVIYHARTIQQTSLAGRQDKSQQIRAMSYRNHWWMLTKNLTSSELVKRLPWLLPYECAKLAYACFSEWSTVRVLPETIHGLARMRRKGYGQD